MSGVTSTLFRIDDSVDSGDVDEDPPHAGLYHEL
jgi:hypothetical protein